MAEYVTLIEAAELEDVKYNTMVRRITRNPDKFDTMTEKSENGGKDAVLVAVASLSKKARNAWKERAKLKELSGTISPEGEAQPERKPRGMSRRMWIGTLKTTESSGTRAWSSAM